MLSRLPLLLAVLGIAQTVQGQALTMTRRAYASTAGARAIESADFDRNGWPDVAHANYGRNSLTVLLNHVGGAAGLSAAFELPLGAGPFDMAAADFNLDGLVDLVVANADADSLSILLGRGNGGFVRTDVPAPGGPRGVAAADMNRDGRPDLVYTGFVGNRVQVLIGTGAGTFTAGPALAPFAPHPQDVAIADFDKDGTQDLAVACASPSGGLVIVSMDPAGRPRAGGGGGPPPQKHAARAAGVAGPPNLNLAAVADFDGDGWLDVAAAATTASAVEIFTGGSSGLRHVASYSTGGSPRGLRVADVNHDGRPDVVTANRHGNSVSVFIGSGDARFDRMDFPAGNGSRALALADFNQDGRLDFATGNQDAASVSVLHNQTDFVRAAYAFSREAVPMHENFSTFRPAFADVNHNGVPDVISDSYVLLDRTAVKEFPLATIDAFADLNADGHVDLIVSEYQSAPRLFVNDGRGEFTAGAFLPAPATRQSIDLGDMNADGRLDLIVSSYDEATGVGTIEILLRDAGGGWTTASRTTVPSWTLSVDVADLNLDGRLDLLTTYFQPTRLDVFPGDGAGGLAAPASYSLVEYGNGVATGDINHDGVPDVVVGGWEHATVFLGLRGRGLAAARVIDDEGYDPKLADMNMDGHLDLVAASTLIFAGVGDGRFAEPERFTPGAFYTGVVDFNGDGLPDLVAEGLAIYNARTMVNRPPGVALPADFAIDYARQFREEDFEIPPEAGDPDLHALDYEWTNQAGELLSTFPALRLQYPPGTHRFTLTVRDGRGGVARDEVAVTIRPQPEIVVRYLADLAYYDPIGSWEVLEDATAADGFRAHDPNAGAPKLSAPRPAPASYLAVTFIADPTQTYKLWLRGKADANHWANDSVWLQFSGATSVAGAPVYRIGTSLGLAVNLEQCSGCGVSGWGWRDERWGPTLTSVPVLLRFPEGGVQQLLIQSREDGLSIDQIVLSAARFLERPPGPARNDTTIVAAIDP